MYRHTLPVNETRRRLLLQTAALQGLSGGGGVDPDSPIVKQLLRLDDEVLPNQRVYVEECRLIRERETNDRLQLALLTGTARSTKRRKVLYALMAREADRGKRSAVGLDKKSVGLETLRDEQDAALLAVDDVARTFYESRRGGLELAEGLRDSRLIAILEEIKIKALDELPIPVTTASIMTDGRGGGKGGGGKEWAAEELSRYAEEIQRLHPAANR